MNNSTLFADNPAKQHVGALPGVTLFICANAEAEAGLRLPIEGVQSVKIACSAMVQDVFLLRAFEAGAEGVLVVGLQSGKM